MPDYAIYLDDSGHPSDKPYVVVAGFLASEDQWIAFEDEWKAALGKYRLGEAFHMTDFEASKRTDRGAVLEHLTSVIIENTRSSFSCIVDMAAYKKINDIYALEEAIGTPYALVTRGVARNINIWKKAYLQPGDRVRCLSNTAPSTLAIWKRHLGEMAFKCRSGCRRQIYAYNPVTCSPGRCSTTTRLDPPAEAC